MYFQSHLKKIFSFFVATVIACSFFSTVFADETAPSDEVVTPVVPEIVLPPTDVVSTPESDQTTSEENVVLPTPPETLPPIVLDGETAPGGDTESASSSPENTFATSTESGLDLPQTNATSSEPDQVSATSTSTASSTPSTETSVDTPLPSSSGSGTGPVIEVVATSTATSTEQNAVPVSASTTPTITEEVTNNIKTVTVSSTPEQDLIAPMINVPVKTEIAEIFKVGQEDQIKIKWQNNGYEEMSFVATDEDGNGYIDHVAWIVPHLSTQTFEIILISHALRLDENKNILEDIFSGVGALDQTYVSLFNGQYVRATFEKNLTSVNDITLYARPTDSNAPATIEVYTQDGTLVATFPSIDKDGRYRIILSGLATPTDTFDLKIIGNVDIDYVTDPPANAY